MKPFLPTRKNWESCQKTPNLTAWPNELPEWDKKGKLEKKLFIRQADIYAAYLAYTDNEIGRVIAVWKTGELDNTLIIYIGGDNGASAEGMLDGTPNEFTSFNGVPVPVKAQMLCTLFGDLTKLFRIMQRVGLGNGYSFQMGKAGSISYRRNNPGRGNFLARPYRRRRWDPG